MPYEFYYWPHVQGRGEYVRLALEEAGADYVDVARVEGPEVLRRMIDADLGTPPFAPPFLKDGGRVLGQTTNILLYLGQRHGLAPKSEAGRLWTNQIQLTIADFSLEAHDTHHPLGPRLSFEEQRGEAMKRAEWFREERLGRFLGWFEKILAGNRGGYLVGRRLTYADLSLFQTVEGLRYAFPKAMRQLEGHHPRVVALHACVADRPRIGAYLASQRRVGFHERKPDWSWLARGRRTGSTMPCGV
jgi:glutathione S-transferase